MAVSVELRANRLDPNILDEFEASRLIEAPDLLPAAYLRRMVRLAMALSEGDHAAEDAGAAAASECD